MDYFSRSIQNALLATLILGVVFSAGVPRAFAASNAVVNATTQISVCGNGIKEDGEQCDGSDFGGATCTYLGFTGGALSCSPSCEYNTSNCTTTADQTATAIFLASIGGNYTVTDNTNNDSLAISLLPNFYSQDLTLEMLAFATSTAASSIETAPSGDHFVGDAYQLVFVDSNGTVVHSISRSATVTISYTAGDMPGIAANTIAPYFFDPRNTGWSPVTSYNSGTSAHTVTFTTSSFSAFALFGMPPASPKTATNLEGSIFPLWAWPFLYTQSNPLLKSLSTILTSSVHMEQPSSTPENVLVQPSLSSVSTSPSFPSTPSTSTYPQTHRKSRRGSSPTGVVKTFSPAHATSQNSVIGTSEAKVPAPSLLSQIVVHSVAILKMVASVAAVVFLIGRFLL